MVWSCPEKGACCRWSCGAEPQTYVSPSRRRSNNRDTVALPPLISSATMAPPTSLSSHERTRVEDYLNDKIQVSADLESLDSLLSSLRAQQELQRKQVPFPLLRS